MEFTNNDEVHEAVITWDLAVAAKEAVLPKLTDWVGVVAVGEPDMLLGR